MQWVSAKTQSMSHHWSRFSQGQNWHLCIERTIKGLGREQVIWNSDVVHTVPIISKIVTSMHRERCMFFPNKSGLWIFPMNQSHVPLEWEQNQIMLEKKLGFFAAYHRHFIEFQLDIVPRKVGIKKSSVDFRLISPEFWPTIPCLVDCKLQYFGSSRVVFSHINVNGFLAMSYL